MGTGSKLKPVKEFRVYRSKRRRAVIIVLVLVCLTVGAIPTGCSRGIPFVGKEGEWSIGIYTGDSPLALVSPGTVRNPVLTAKDVTDIQALFVADPFMVRERSTWYMFFEVMNGLTNQGDIGYATSGDGFHWVYQQIVLDEPFHLSYPYVFNWKNEYYMIPESIGAGAIRLYKAIDFPTRWLFNGTLLGYPYVDPSVFRYEDRWWMFAGSDRNSTLHLFYADELMGPWTEHLNSPIVRQDANIARPGGRILVHDRIIRYAQDDDPTYGNQIRAFIVTTLTTESYEEREESELLGVKASGVGWNSAGMHAIDAHQDDESGWIACVDGYQIHLVFGWGH